MGGVTPGLLPRPTTGGASRWGGLHRASHNWILAFAAQGLSSATSLGLSLLVGRTLGASVLGVAFAGFSAYVMLLALHRALVTTPLVSSSSSLDEAQRITATRTALGATMTIAVSGSGLMAVIGVIVGGPIGRGLLVFAPWLLPAFAQELFRSSLFRDGRGRLAALTDMSWLVTMLIAAPFAARIDTLWAIISAWGLGSVVAALIGGIAMRATPTSLSIARTWFVRVAFPFGRWLAVQEGVALVVSYALIVVLTGILGSAAVGGFRAADSVFGIFTLMAPAMLLAGLPATSRALARSRQNAVVLSILISSVGVLITILYSGLMIIVGPHILTTLYGVGFSPYTSLVVPISVLQVVMMAGIGFSVLLRAERRGKTNLAIGTTSLLASLATSSFLAAAAGISGAVWGLAVGQAVGSSLLVWYGVRGPRRVSERLGGRTSGLPTTKEEARRSLRRQTNTTLR